MSFYDAIRVGASAADTALTIDRSVRFNGGRETNAQQFTRTGTSTVSTYTISMWAKNSGVGTGLYRLFFSIGQQNDANAGWVGLTDTDTMYFQGGNGTFSTSTEVFRDPSAWFHFLISVNSNNFTVYINGTSLKTGTIRSLDTSTNGIRIGVNYGNYYPWDGYIADYYLIDGSALTPSSFTETNVETGQLVPKLYTGSFGTEGAHLKFNDNSSVSALGTDSSGNGNNYTVTGDWSVSAGAGNDSLEDTPTNNWCTWNPLSKDGGTTFSNGNLDISSANYGNNTATFFVTSGKWYWEGVGSGYVGAICGVDGQNFPNSLSSSGSNSIGYWSGNGYAYWGGGSTGSGTTFSSSDVIGIALDMDNGTVKFYKNNTLIHNLTFGSGTIPDLSAGVFPVYNNGTIGTTFTAVHNFGQRAFSYTPPTGFKALNSANLPDPTILLPNKHFDTLLWTGTAASHTLTGLNFQPDWFWAKSRSQAYHNTLMDSVRGVDRQLWSNRSNNEQTDANFLISFNSNGLTLGDNSSGTGATNTNGHTYVGWNWNAGDTDGKTYTVKVVSDSGNKYRFNDFGTSAVTLDLAEGGTYTFDQSDSSMSSHPMQLSTTANGTHGGGSAYSTGVTYELDGSTVTASAFISGFSSASSRKLIITVAASAPTLYYYCYYHSGMGGQANTNSTLGSSNFDGTLQATVKANTTAGFSIITWTGNQTSGATLGHGLGVAPKAAFVKRRDYLSSNWISPLFDLQTAGKLNSSDAFANSYYNVFFTSQPSSTVLTIGSNDDINRNTSTYVAYVFSEVAGYSKFGSYTGNGNANGTFVYTGFRPAWVLISNSNAGFDWVLQDSKRSPSNVADKKLNPNQSAAEQSNYDKIDILSNGFKPRVSDAGVNANGSVYYYWAFAESPFKNSRAR